MTANYIQGERIYLREVRITDVNDAYYSWINDPEVNSFLETRFFPRSIDNIKEYVTEKNNNSNEPFFAICLTDKNRHIGNIKLGPINWLHRKADISLFIGVKELWGKGLGTEAIGLIATYAFKTLGLNKIKAGAYADNKASISAFEKSGFQKEGLLKNEAYSDGQFKDLVLLGCGVDDYMRCGDRK